MTEKMIPLSVVDALIAKLEKQQKESVATLQRLYKIEMLQEIKKEAIPSPSELQIEKPTHEQEKPVQEQGLEQKILQRIKEVESMTGGGEITRKSFLYELRKLVE